MNREFFVYFLVINQLIYVHHRIVLLVVIIQFLTYVTNRFRSNSKERGYFF